MPVSLAQREQRVQFGDDALPLVASRTVSPYWAEPLYGEARHGPTSFA